MKAEPANIESNKYIISKPKKSISYVSIPQRYEKRQIVEHMKVFESPYWCSTWCIVTNYIGQLSFDHHSPTLT